MGLTPTRRRSCRYPQVMAEEGLQVVRQWLEASSPLEEGEGLWEGSGWGWPSQVLTGAHVSD